MPLLWVVSTHILQAVGGTCEVIVEEVDFESIKESSVPSFCPLSLATPTMYALQGRMADFPATGSLGEERGPIWGEDA